MKIRLLRDCELEVIGSRRFNAGEEVEVEEVDVDITDEHSKTVTSLILDDGSLAASVPNNLFEKVQ